MKLECSKDKLKDIVMIAERATGKNLSLPILSAVVLEAGDGQLTVRATNIDLGVELEIPAKVTTPGIVALSATILGGFLSNLTKEDKVSLELINDNISISTKTSSTLIKSLPADDFPSIPQVVEGDGFKIPAKSLINSLKSVVYAAAVSDIRPELSSVYIYQDDGGLTCVATDSFRLAEKKIPIKIKGEEFIPVMIPHKNITELLRVLELINGEVTIQTNKNQISFYADQVHFTSRLIDGVYPDYKQIMPKEFKTQITIPREEILNALRLTQVFTDRSNQILIKAEPKEKRLEISSRHQDVGENQVILNTNISGDTQEANFNSRYILDVFSVIGSDNIELKFIDRSRPLLIQAAGDSSFRYIVMPINR
jgi:DNA polymerase-3 subunit beta